MFFHKVQRKFLITILKRYIINLYRYLNRLCSGLSTTAAATSANVAAATISPVTRVTDGLIEF